MELPQSDPALEAFDKLRVREVRADYGHSASAFLAKFQSTAANLEPDERIKLELIYTRDDVESIKAILSDPQANKICALKWRYEGKEDVNSVIPLLIDSCPELASLNVYFAHHSAFAFVSSMLEHPSTKIKVLEMPSYTEGDLARYFVALGQSRVSALVLSNDASPEFTQGLCEYLAKDLLVRLEVSMDRKQVAPEMMMLLAKCTCLVKLVMLRCDFFESAAFTHLPKSITTLTLDNCRFGGGFDWSFLADSNVRELDFDYVGGVDGNQLGSALAVHLRAKGLDKLRLHDRDIVDEVLAATGAELGRIKRLEPGGYLIDASIKLIALALQSLNSELRELKLWYAGPTASSIENHLVPALKHPNCNLAKLRFSSYGGQAKAVEDVFHNCLALFVLLQGRQVRRLYCPLRRLPVEMFRLVGAALI